jgi:hypothetical protein
MAPPIPTIPRAAEPKHSVAFDAWNSSSTGHQRAENRLGGSIGWRQSRNMKLSSQFISRGTGGERISDQVGAGSQDWDEKAKALIPKDVRCRARTSVRDLLLMHGKPGWFDDTSSHCTNSDNTIVSALPRIQGPGGQLLRTNANPDAETIPNDDAPPVKRGIFDGLVMYVNGSTQPLISDHKLKQMFAENGGSMSLHLGRRQVTHVVLGNASAFGGNARGGSGGGLAATKIQKEIKTVRGCGVKYVGVEW